jgi:RNA-directed DNA polymerase
MSTKKTAIRLLALAARLVFLHDREQAPPLSALIDTLAADPTVSSLWDDAEGPAAEVRLLLDSPTMRPPTAEILRLIRVPELPTAQDLADWLGLSVADLDWLADRGRRRSESESPRLCHYHYRWQPRRDRPPRLIEAPKSRIKAIQRKILREILERIPLHPDAHGFRRRRSCLTYVQPHLRQDVLLRLDLKDFFRSVPIGRVNGVFDALGYPPTVAGYLTGLCTHAASGPLLSPELTRLDWHSRKRLTSPHLPQGAPSSPALANLCCWWVDCRLEGLARKMRLSYSRYADDLAFSGPRWLAGRSYQLHALVGAIVAEEGFRLNFRKTRLMTAAQRQSLAGMVINRHPNIAREDYDQLKATLFNCVRHGPTSQNRAGVRNFKAHLEGRIAQVASLNAPRGEKLRALFSAISWDG